MVLPEDLPNPGIEPRSPALQADALLSEPPGKPFLFFSFFYLNLFILIGGQLLYSIVLVLPYINMNLSRVYTCSLSWTPPSTSLPVPSLWVIPVHQPQASCILHQTWTGDSLLIWCYTCFNAILPNHPTFYFILFVLSCFSCVWLFANLWSVAH